MSDIIFQGFPKRRINCSTKALSTVLAFLFCIGTDAKYLENPQMIVIRNIFPGSVGVSVKDNYSFVYGLGLLTLKKNSL